MFAQRLIQEFHHIFVAAKLPLWLHPYNIIATSSEAGLIETIVDAKSIDSIKKDSPNVVTLQDYFIGRFGGRGSPGYKRAVRNFVQSMAGYSVVSYLLNIKDRHNGNLMIDAEGHVIHIDFGFLLSNSPGGNLEFERSPFKLTNEMAQVMGGTSSGAWKLFRKLCIQGYVEACRHANKFMLMVDILYPGNEKMPCFLQGRDFVLSSLSERFGVDLSRRERAARMGRLIDTAYGNWTTRAYDQFQRLSLGISK
jgi:phosphatidylinositol 4-kinase B